MIRLDECFKLVVGATAPAERQQASLLRTFFRQSVSRRCAGGPLVQQVNLPATVPEPLPEPAMALALAPLLPRDNLIVFDAESLIERAGFAAYALLTPASLEAFLHPKSGSAGQRLARLLALEGGLRACRAVVAFDVAQARALATLGARTVHLLPLPALARPATGPTPRGGVLLVAHDVPDEAATSIAALVRAAGPDLRITMVAGRHWNALSATVLDDAANAELHIHVGLAREPPPSLRIIDSFAARKPVIHVCDRTPPETGDAIARLQMSVEPFQSGFIARTPAEMVSAVQHVRGDPAMVDIFSRNMDQTVAVYNADIERRLWEALV
jgi:hypothetical protein